MRSFKKADKAARPCHAPATGKRAKKAEIKQEKKPEGHWLQQNKRIPGITTGTHTPHILEKAYINLAPFIENPIIKSPPTARFRTTAASSCALQARRSLIC
jgi:hypothetical protein